MNRLSRGVIYVDDSQLETPRLLLVTDVLNRFFTPLHLEVRSLQTVLVSLRIEWISPFRDSEVIQEGQAFIHERFVCNVQYKSYCIALHDVLFLVLSVREPGSVKLYLQSESLKMPRQNWQPSACTVICVAFLDSMVRVKSGSLLPVLLSFQLIIRYLTTSGAVYIRQLPMFL